MRVPDDTVAEDAASVLRGLAGTDGLTDLIFVGDLDARDAAPGEVEVDVRTARTLGGVERDRLVGRALS